MSGPEKASLGLDQSKAAAHALSLQGIPAPESATTVIVITARSALAELETKLTHVEVEAVRRYVGANAFVGSLVEPDVPILSLQVDLRPNVSRTVTVQYFIAGEPRSPYRRLWFTFPGRPHVYNPPNLVKVCIVAIDPDECNQTQCTATSQTAITLTPLARGRLRATATNILQEFQRQGISLGVHDLLSWLARHFPG